MYTATLSSPTILASDAISAKVIYRGASVLNITLSGVASMSELYKAVASAVKQVKGMATLSLRNISQGWNISRPIMLAC